MTEREILIMKWTKTRKAEALYDLGYTRNQIADLICNGNKGFAYNIWKKWNANRTSMTLSSDIINFDFLFNRKFGVEIEFYGADLTELESNFRTQNLNIQTESYNHSTRSHWKLVTDSSIRGNNGRELVSPVLQNNEGLSSFRKACKALRLSKAEVNSSCGVHIHLDVNDYDVDNFKTLVKNQFIIENQIDKMMPKSRRNNRNCYCQGFASNNKNIFFQKIDRCTTITELINVFNTRYYKLNLKSFQRHGTVEFRQHGASTNYIKIKNWILICARLVEFSKLNILLNDVNQILDESLQEYFEDRELSLQ